MRSIYAISWIENEDDSLIATGAADNRICVFEIDKSDMENSESFAYNVIAKQNMAHSSDINCVQFCPSDHRLLASCADDGLIKLWRI